MNRFATIVLFASLATVSLAQNPPPPPGEPGRPPRPGGPGAPGEDERMRLHDQLRLLDEKLAKIEQRFADGSMSKAEEADLRDESKKLQAERQAVEAKLKKMGPGDRMPGGPGRPGEPPMGPEGMGPSGPRPPRGVALTAEDVSKALAWIGTNEPVRLQRLNDLKQTRPEEYERAVTQVAFEIRDLLALKQNDAKRYEQRVKQRNLDYKATELAEKIRAAGPNQEMKAEREDLKAILGQLFDLREDDREQELKRLAEELQRLKETTQKRRDSKDKIVDRRLAELLGEEDDMGWDPKQGPKQGDPPPPPPRDR